MCARGGHSVRTSLIAHSAGHLDPSPSSPPCLITAWSKEDSPLPWEMVLRVEEEQQRGQAGSSRLTYGVVTTTVTLLRSSASAEAPPDD